MTQWWGTCLDSPSEELGCGLVVEHLPRIPSAGLGCGSVAEHLPSISLFLDSIPKASCQQNLRNFKLFDYCSFLGGAQAICLEAGAKAGGKRVFRGHLMS